jgi:hypothetical protein
MVCRHHRAFAGSIAATARPAGGDTRSARRRRAPHQIDGLPPPSRLTPSPAGDPVATPPQWWRALAAAAAAAILGFYLPSLLARGEATGTPAPACDRAGVETSAGAGC